MVEKRIRSIANLETNGLTYESRRKNLGIKIREVLEPSKDYLKTPISIRSVTFQEITQDYKNTTPFIEQTLLSFMGTESDFFENVNDLIEDLKQLNNNRDADPTLQHVYVVLMNHWDQLEEDTLLNSLDDIVSSIQRIKVLEKLIGPANLQLLKKHRLLDKNMHFREEIERISQGLLTKVMDLGKSIEDEKYNFTIKYIEGVGEREIFTDEPMVPGETLEELKSTLGKITELRKILIKLRYYY